jgi:hypothetical protein
VKDAQWLQSRYELSREAIAAFPEITDRAPIGVVINALLMRAADYLIRHRDRYDTMFIDEFDNLMSGCAIMPHVGGVRAPRPHLLWLTSLCVDYADCDFGCAAQIRP